MTKMLSIILAACLTVTGQFVQADDYQADDLIKYRQHGMDAIKHHNNAIKMILQGKVPHDQDLNMHITSLGKLVRRIDNWFPEGSDFGETNAKDAVWDKPEKFSEANMNAVAAFKAFKTVTEQGDRKASLKAFKKFGKDSCGSCHKQFKKKDD